MIKKDYQLTKQGKDELQKELEELKSRRGEVAQKIAEARDFGDLSENAEYDAARGEQSVLENRIAEIEDILQNATIIKTKDNSKVAVGNTVTLENAKGKKVTYTIVGSVEADPLEGKISDQSPIGRALLGKKVGDEVSITAPGGEIVYKVVAIS